MPTSKSPGREQGLTLMELLITTAVAGILLAVGVPSFFDFITSNRAAGYASDLIADMNYARSEAIARGMRVVVCKGATVNSCTTGEWEGGWKVFVDCNNSISRTTTAVCPDWDGNGAADAEPLLRVHDALAAGWTMRGSAGSNLRNRVIFMPTGLTNSSNLGTISICRDGGAGGLVDSELGRAIILNVAGRARVATDSDNDGTLDDGDNTELSCTP